MAKYKISGLSKQMMNKTLTFCLVTLFLGSTFSGCLDSGLFSNNDEKTIVAPTWTKGDFWQYSVKTQNMEISTTMVVSIDDDATDYYVGAGSLEDAKRHAVLNHNPALGRVQISDFAVYENNVPQKIIDFPLKSDKSWSFNLYGEDFVAIVLTNIRDENTDVEISATSNSVSCTIMTPRQDGSHTFNILTQTVKMS